MLARNRWGRGLAVLTASACALVGLTALAPSAGAASAGLVINEFYGRGGSANQPYSHKFVELYNPTGEDIPLAGTSLQYRSATGAGNASGLAPLSGSVAAGGYFLVQLNSNGGTGVPLPTPDQVTTIAPSGTTGTVFLASGTAATSPDGTSVIDKLGYGTSNSPEGRPVAYPGANGDPGSLYRTNGVDTDDNAADFTFSATVTPQNSGSEGSDPDPDPDPGPQPGPKEVGIAQIQGTGAATPLDGQRVATTGVVIAAYPTGGFSGVYIQTPGTGGAPKSAGEASDGVFVFSSWAAGNTQVGDCVAVEGTAAEYFTLTQLAGNPIVTKLAADECQPVTPTPLASLPATDADKERYEGMLVQPQGTYTITNNYALNQFGTADLAFGYQPLYQATEVVAPGPEAVAYEAQNLTRLVTLDDGASLNFLTNAAAKASPLPYLSAATPMRTGSQVTFARPVILDYRYNAWNFQPRAQVVGHDSPMVPLAPVDDREVAVPEVGGNLQLAAFNVLNYFDDLGRDEEGCRAYTDMHGDPVAANGCQVRGAWSGSAFADQKAKIVSAINGMDADVVALMEIENSAGLTYKPGQPRDKAVADLVAGLNEAAGSTRWAYAPSPRVVPPNEDIIRTAFIYDRRTVQLLGPSLIDLDSAFADARYPLAQKFKARSTGNPFVVVANHFKSKGSGADDGTGQGLANPSREAQARQLTAWASEMFAGESVFLVGDFNAYSKETPIQIIEAAGYTNTAKRFEPTSATYQFGGRLGSLDHVFANDKAMRMVTGAAVWDINGDESIAFQYSRRNYNVVDFHSDDQFASSDHDPVVVGLDTRNRGNGNLGQEIRESVTERTDGLGEQVRDRIRQRLGNLGQDVRGGQGG